MSLDSKGGRVGRFADSTENCRDSRSYFFETEEVYEITVVILGLGFFSAYLYEGVAVLSTGLGSFSVYSFFFVTFPMVTSVVGSVWFAHRLRTSDFSFVCKRRVVSWMVFGGFAGTVTAGVIIFQNSTRGGVSANPVNTVLLVAEAGVIAGTVVGVYNARNRKNLKDLKESKTSLEMYRRVFERTENPVVITDTTPEIVDVNDAYVEKFGYTRDELSGEGPSIVGSSATSDEVYEEMWGQLEEGDTWSDRVIDVTRDGRRLHLHLTVAPIYVDGEMWGYAGIFADITEVERLAESLEVVNRILRHDLRNDLTVALGRIGVVKHNVTDDEEKEIHESLEDAEEKLRRVSRKADQARVIREVLNTDVSETVEVDLYDVLDSVINEASLVSDSDDLEIDRLYADSSLPSPMRAEAVGRKYVHKAFKEVIENAVEHSPDSGRVEVDVSQREETVVVSVADEGSGIPDGQKEEVFGRRERDELNHGEGMGLFLAHRILEKSKGRIWVEDSEYGGAEFKMEFRSAE